MRAKLHKARLAVQNAFVREKALKTQVDFFNGVGQVKTVAVYYAVKALLAHWRKKYTALEVTYAAERRTVLAKLEASGKNRISQWARTFRAEKISVV